MIELQVRNPVAELNSKPTPRAARAKTLDGIDLGLWWNKKIGGEVAVEFSERSVGETSGCHPSAL